MRTLFRLRVEDSFSQPSSVLPILRFFLKLLTPYSSLPPFRSVLLTLCAERFAADCLGFD